MWKAIDLKKIDELLSEYQDFKHKGESFSSFIEGTTDSNVSSREIPVWDWVDSIGVVTPEDFNEFKEDFVEANFENLAHCWYNGLNGQIDFGIVLDCIKDEFPDGLKKK